MPPAGHFGPAVIGEEQAAEEQEVVEESLDRFGEAVTSDSHMGGETPSPPAEPEEGEGDAFPEGYTVEQSGNWFAVFAPDGTPVESEYDSGKFQGRDDAAEAAWAHAEAAEAEEGEEPEAAEAGEPVEIADATIEEVESALAENPHLVDQFMRAEIQRPDGVRLEAIEAMEAAERSKDEPREEVFETLGSLRAELEGGGEGSEASGEE